MHALVKIRKLNYDGKTIDSEHSNTLIDMRAYEVEFIDGTTETLTANNIAKYILAHMDEEGHRQLLLDKTIDYQRNGDVVNKNYGFV